MDYFPSLNICQNGIKIKENRNMGYILLHREDIFIFDDLASHVSIFTANGEHINWDDRNKTIVLRKTNRLIFCSEIRTN